MRLGHFSKLDSMQSEVREVHTDQVVGLVRELALRASLDVREDHLSALRRGLETEQSPLGCAVLRGLLENADVAARERLPICQDTGYAVVFCELGQDVHLVGGGLQAA